ncbi:MAG: sulfotransferase family protein [Brevundimonas sp.]|uniref:sulfotransferase family protein n=1 Tax=Brevundimonas sp. TaxID=1871086 RepID=UPI00391C1839
MDASDAAAPEPALFFALGVPKSGTTWVERALNAHPEVVCKGEGKFHYFRDRLADAGKTYNAFMTERNMRVFGEAVFPRLNIDEVDAVFKAFVETRMRRDGPFPGARRLGCKDPDFGLYIEEYAALFPDIDYVHIIRDPRDTALSMLRHMERVHPEVRFPSIEASLKDTALGWRNYITSVRAETERHGLSCLEFTYEAMKADPQAALGRVFEFLGVDASPTVVAACVAATRFERLSQGRQPGQEDRSSFYRRGVAGGWRDELSAAQAELILEAAGPIAAELGYR